MFVVVPVEEGFAVGAGVFDGAEPVGELGAVFESLELGLGVGVVVGDMRPRMGLGDTEFGDPRPLGGERCGLASAPGGRQRGEDTPVPLGAPPAERPEL